MKELIQSIFKSCESYFSTRKKSVLIVIAKSVLTFVGFYSLIHFYATLREYHKSIIGYALLLTSIAIIWNKEFKKLKQYELYIFLFFKGVITTYCVYFLLCFYTSLLEYHISIIGYALLLTSIAIIWNKEFKKLEEWAGTSDKVLSLLKTIVIVSLALSVFVNHFAEITRLFKGKQQIILRGKVTDDDDVGISGVKVQFTFGDKTSLCFITNQQGEMDTLAEVNTEALYGKVELFFYGNDEYYAVPNEVLFKGNTLDFEQTIYSIP